MSSGWRGRVPRGLIAMVTLVVLLWGAAGRGSGAGAARAQGLDFMPFVNQWRHQEFVLNVDATGRAVAVWPAACPAAPAECRVYADITFLTAAGGTAYGTVDAVQDQDGRPYDEPLFAPGARVMLVVMSFDMAVLIVDRQSLVLCGVRHRTTVPRWFQTWWGAGSPCSEEGRSG